MGLSCQQLSERVNMIVNLCCSNNEKTLIEMLKIRGITVDNEASICLVERGNNIPENGIIIIFDPTKLDELVEFLNEIKSTTNHKIKESSVLAAKNEDIYELVPIDNIYYFIAEGNFVYCESEKSKVEVKKKLYELEEELAHKGFIRVNKSYIVNILKIKEIIPWFSGRLLLRFKSQKEDVTVSRNYVKSFKNFLGI